MGGNMKMHQYDFPCGILIRSSWDQQSQIIETPAPANISSFCKRLRPLLPNIHTTTTSSNSSTANSSTAFRFDLKSFIKPHHCASNRTNVSSSDDHITDQLTQLVDTSTHPGGTRWNPTQEQIGILEKLYKGGMRTPNAQQIEQITSQLAKYGKIEGKNVFYWFQNHKARQRQKLKRQSLCLPHSPRTSSTAITSTTSSMEDQEFEDNYIKRKRSTWSVMDQRNTREDGGDETLELFPLHPEGRS